MTVDEPDRNALLIAAPKPATLADSSTSRIGTDTARPKRVLKPDPPLSATTS